MTQEHVIAVDPGDTTGYACGVWDGAACSLHAHGEREWLAFCEWLYGQLRRKDIDRVVIESWRLRGRTGPALTGSSLVPVQCIGAIRLICLLTRTPLSVQEPAVKSVIDKMMGGTSYLPKGSTHAKDAVRHLFYYFMTNKKGDTP